MEDLLEGGTLLRLLVSYLNREDLYLLLFSFVLMCQWLDRAIS